MNKSLCRSAVRVSPIVLAGLAALAGMTGCVQDPLPFDPVAARKWELATDSEVNEPAKPPLPTKPREPYIPGVTQPDPLTRLMSSNALRGPAVKLTLQQVVHRAIINNEEIRVASFDTAIDQTRILEAEANFDPTLVADTSFQRIDKMTPGTESVVVSPNANSNTNSVNSFHDIVVRYDEEALSVSDIGIKQNLPAGGQIEIQEQINSVWSNPTRGILQSFYQNDLMLTLTQPLLQNFGIAVNRARITIAQNNSRISLLDFRNTVEKTVLTIEQTYWQLVQTQRDAKATRELLRSYNVLRDKLYHRRGAGGDVTDSQLEQVNAETSNREGQLIQLQFRIATLSNSLKQLMNDPAYPVSGDAIVLAIDPGTELPMRFNEDDQIATAMDNRYELGQQQVRVDSSLIAADVARNNLLPSLNAQISATVDGLGRHIEDAFSKEGDFNHFGYQAQLQFSFPLGNRAAESIWRRSLLQRMQAIHSYVGLVNQIALDVRNAGDTVDEAYYFLEKARDSRLHYERTLSLLQILDEKGDQPITFDSLFVELQIRQSLLASQLSEHQALNDYNFAIANLEKVKGTILRYDNVMMEQEQLPFGMEAKGDPLVKEYLLGTQHPRSEKPVMPIVTPPFNPPYEQPPVTTQPTIPPSTNVGTTQP